MINCEFESGSKANLRHLTVDSIAIKDNKILLPRRAKTMSQGGKFCLPGGYLSRDESTKEGALRELFEETGYKGEIIDLFMLVDETERGDDKQNVTFIYIIKVLEKTGEPDNESSEVTWFDLDKLPDESEIAFDHGKIIKRFKKYLEDRTNLPIINY